MESVGLKEEDKALDRTKWKNAVPYTDDGKTRREVARRRGIGLT